MRDSHTSSSSKRLWELKAFTDNVVLGFPVQRKADEQTLAHLIESVAALQRGFILEGGFFPRGGIAFGELYIDDDVVYGVALLDAHCAESHSVTPRIILAPSAASLIPLHARRYAPMTRSPQARYLLQDEDGQLFVNYLAGVSSDDEEAPNYHWLERHRDLVTERLVFWKRDSKVLSKYVWAARYHTYICTTVQGANKYRLRRTVTALKPQRIEHIYPPSVVAKNRTHK